MPQLLSGIPLSDEQRKKNDGPHRPMVVLAVLGMLLIYMYLFSSLSMRTTVPTPVELASNLGLASSVPLDEDGNIRNRLHIRWSQRFRGDDERLVLFLVVAVAFLTVYFVPLQYKRPSLVFWTLVGLTVLYGPRTTAGLVFAHLVVYLTLHPRRKRAARWSALAGVIGYGAFGQASWGIWGFVPAGLAGALIYQLVFLQALSRPRYAAVLRTTVVQSAMLTVFIGSVFEGLFDRSWTLVMGILLFFWQWERLMMYHADYKDGLVPKDLSVQNYLSIFLSPGVLGSWNWGVTIAQGYHYTTNNFLCENKNTLALAGVKLWAIGLLYILIYDSLVRGAGVLFWNLGVDIHGAKIELLVRDYAAGSPQSTPAVLLTTLLDRLRWLVLWGGVVHFKVGVWRICGYRVDAYFDKPWMATNLVSLWFRFTFHYREFMVRCFYYPVFFRFFKRHTKLRIFAATMAAAAFGNLVWGHIGEGVFYKGFGWNVVLGELRTWPYFVSLGLGITLTEFYLMRKKSRRSNWTLDRWLFLDVLCAYGTMQYFGLITIFRRGTDVTTIWDQARLVLIGLGLHL